MPKCISATIMETTGALAPAVNQVRLVEFSDYHRMDKLHDEEDVYDEETGDYKTEVRRVVVIG
jgi:hypothetical protein